MTTAALVAETPPQPRPAGTGRPTIHLDNVRKSYGHFDALSGLSFEINQDEIFGLIGPSGCGKTTLAQLLVGRVAASEGRVFVWGRDPAHFGSRERQEIGYMPQGFALYPTLSLEQNARFVAALYGLGWRQRRRRVKEVLRFLELWDARKRLAKDASGGMQRRLSLACALLHSPRLLIIDEPTAGLDPILRARIWEHLRSLRAAGVTVVVTTQYVDEASYCDRVALLRDGHLVAIGTPNQLRAEAIGGETLVVQAESLARADVAALWSLDVVRRVEWNGRQRVRLLVDDAAAATPEVTAFLSERGVPLLSVSHDIPTFDEVFVALLDQA